MAPMYPALLPLARDGRRDPSPALGRAAPWAACLLLWIWVFFPALGLAAPPPGPTAPQPVPTAPAPIPASAESTTIGGYAEFLEDPGGKLDLDAVRQPGRGFAPLGREIAHFGRTDSAFWLRFRIRHDGPRPLTRVLSCETPWLDDVRLHILAPDGSHVTHLLGDTLPFATRGRAHNLFLTELTLDPGMTTIYVRVQTKGPMMVPLSLWSEWEFLRHDRLLTLCFGVFYGGILAIFLYNLFLYVSLRDPVHLLYPLHLLAYFGMSLSLHGIAFMWLWPEYPDVNRWINSTLIYIVEVTGLLFAASFLGTRRYPRLNRLILALSVLYGTLAALVCLGVNAVRMAASIPLLLPYYLVMFGAGVYAWTQGNRAARFYLLGTASGLLGSIASTAVNNGLLPYHFLSLSAYEIGIFLDSTLLSFAIADRMRQVELERRHAVHLAQTDPLTVLLNRRGFEEHAERELVRARRYNRPLAVVVLDIDHFKRVNDRHSHAGGDVVLLEIAHCLQQGARVSDLVGRWGGEEFILLLPETDLTEAAQLAERLRLGIAGRRIAFGGEEIPCTASFGVAGLAPSDTLDSLIHRADTLLYRAKDQGRNRVLAEAEAEAEAKAVAEPA